MKQPSEPREGNGKLMQEQVSNQDRNTYFFSLVKYVISYGNFLQPAQTQWSNGQSNDVQSGGRQSGVQVSPKQGGLLDGAPGQGGQNVDPSVAILKQGPVEYQNIDLYNIHDQAVWFDRTAEACLVHCIVYPAAGAAIGIYFSGCLLSPWNALAPYLTYTHNGTETSDNQPQYTQVIVECVVPWSPIPACSLASWDALAPNLTYTHDGSLPDSLDQPPTVTVNITCNDPWEHIDNGPIESVCSGDDIWTPSVAMENYCNTFECWLTSDVTDCEILDYSTEYEYDVLVSSIDDCVQLIRNNVKDGIIVVPDAVTYYGPHDHCHVHYGYNGLDCEDYDYTVYYDDGVFEGAEMSCGWRFP